jgi:hypothetical protein
MRTSLAAAPLCFSIQVLWIPDAFGCWLQGRSRTNNTMIGAWGPTWWIICGGGVGVRRGGWATMNEAWGPTWFAICGESVDVRRGGWATMDRAWGPTMLIMCVGCGSKCRSVWATMWCVARGRTWLNVREVRGVVYRGEGVTMNRARGPTWLILCGGCGGRGV